MTSSHFIQCESVAPSVVVSVDGVEGRRSGQDGRGDARSSLGVDPTSHQEQGEGHATTPNPRLHHRA